MLPNVGDCKLSLLCVCVCVCVYLVNLRPTCQIARQSLAYSSLEQICDSQDVGGGGGLLA